MGKRAWRPHTPTFKHPAIQSDRGVFLCTRESCKSGPASGAGGEKWRRGQRGRRSKVGNQRSGKRACDVAWLAKAARGGVQGVEPRTNRKTLLPSAKSSSCLRPDLRPPISDL